MNELDRFSAFCIDGFKEISPNPNDLPKLISAFRYLEASKGNKEKLNNICFKTFGKRIDEIVKEDYPKMKGDSLGIYRDILESYQSIVENELGIMVALYGDDS